MSTNDAVARMMAHLKDVAKRVAECEGDLRAIRSIIDEYSCLDEETRRLEGESAVCEGIPAEWVTAPESDPDVRMLYIHGGSWMSGSPAGYRPFASRIARAGSCSVLLLDYSLAPEHPFPEGLTDCVRAFHWMQGQSPTGPAGRPRVSVIAGDSAGGNLTLATALRLKDEKADRLPDALICLSPATDLTWSGGSVEARRGIDPIINPDRLVQVAGAYVQGAAEMDHPHVSPLFGDLSGLPELLIQVGEAEVLLDDSTRLAERAQALGVKATLEIYPQMPHVFQMFAPTVTQARTAIDRIGEVVKTAGQTS